MASKIALFIDAENISHKYLADILEEAPLHGQIILQAIYGDWESPTLQKWREIAEANNFKIRHQTNLKIKNSSDMKLIMDAMEVLYRTQVDIFCLVTNDADYVPLCDKIHESKKKVIGIGYPQASEAFMRSCDKFVIIGRGESLSQPLIQPETLLPKPIPPHPPTKSVTPVQLKAPVGVPKQPTPPKLTNPQVIENILSKAFAKAPQDANRWVALTALGQALREAQPGSQKKIYYGHSTLTKFLKNFSGFVEFSTNGKSARLKNKK